MFTGAKAAVTLARCTPIPYPNTDSPGQPAECAAGNETFDAATSVIGNPPGNLGLQDREDEGDL